MNSVQRSLNKETTWWKIVLTLWLIVIFIPLTVKQLGEFLPGSFWIDIKEVIVTNNTTDTNERIITYNRDIKRNFRGDWETSEELLTRRGFSPVRVCTGRTNYRADRTIEEPITLQWLIDKKTEQQLSDGIPQNCIWRWPYNLVEQFPPGSYRVCVTVKPQTVFGVKHEQECSSIYPVPIPGEPRN